MKGQRRLKSSLKSFSKEKVSNKTIYYGELGVTLGGSQVVDVPGRDGFVFVRIKGNTSELIQALNSSVPSAYGLAVLLHREGTNYKIIGKDVRAYSNQGTQIPGGVFPLPRHGGQHSFAPELNIGADPVWVFDKQFMRMLTYPSGSSTLLTINPAFYEWNGSWKYAQNTGSINFAPYVPTITGSARMALLYISPADNGLKIAAGTPFSGDITDKGQLAQYIPDVDRNTSIPLAAVKLITGTTSILWTDLYDMRDFYTVSKRFEGIAIQDDSTPVGTGTVLNFGNNLSVSMAGGIATINAAAGGGGGGGQIGIMGWDEGIPLGTGTTLNFVGPNVDASISGSVIRVFVTGSSGGTNPPVTGSVVVQDEGQPLGSVTVLNFVGAGVDVSVSGTTARVHVTGSAPSISWLSSEKFIVDNLTPQATGSNTNFSLLYSMVSGTSNLYYNGVRQKVGDHYTVGAGLNSVATLFTPTSPDNLIATYEITVSGSVTQSPSSSSSNGRVLIAEVTPNGVSTVTVASSIPSTYKKLVIEYVVRSTEANNFSYLNLIFNNDTTTTNYRYQMIFGHSNTTNGAEGGDTYRIASVSASNSPSGSPGVGVIEIPFYANSSFNKIALSTNGQRYDNSAVHEITRSVTMEWENTTPITRVDMSISGGNFDSGSDILLYAEF